MSGLTPTVDEATAHVDEHGWAVLPSVLSDSEVADAREALLRAAAASEARGIPTTMEYLDPGGRNIRVYDLPEYDPVFADLLPHPTVVPHVLALLDGDVVGVELLGQHRPAGSAGR